MILTSHDSIFKVLHLVATTGVQVHLSGKEKYSLRTLLLDVQNDSIQVQISNPGAESALELHEVHTFRVYVAGHPMQFKCQLLALATTGSGEDALLAKFSFPSEVERKDARAHTRIPVQTQDQVPVTFATDQIRIEGTLIDVSHAGVRMTVGRQDRSNFLVGLPGKVSFELRGKLYELPVIPMWQSDIAMGFLLPEMQQVCPNDTDHFWTGLVREMLLENLCASQTAA